MKFLTQTILLLFAVCVSSTAQTPFKASQGKASAITNAKSAGFTNPKLTAIATIGDTAFFGSFVPAAVKGILKFDATSGKSAFWGYRFNDVIAGKDTSTAYFVTNLVIYLAFQASIPSIPNLPVLIDSTLPASYMDSDLMTSKIVATPIYQSYLQAHPKAKWQAVALGISQGGNFPKGPMWVAFIGDDLNGDPLTCFVEAADNTGNATCIAISSASDNESLASSEISVYPNPLRDGSLKIHIPTECYEPEITIEIYSTIGEKLKSFQPQRIGGGVDVNVDVQDIANGTYLLKFGGAKGSKLIPFSIDR